MKVNTLTLSDRELALIRRSLKIRIDRMRVQQTGYENHYHNELLAELKKLYIDLGGEL